MSKNIYSILIALIVIVAIILTMCAFQVRFTETAVVTRFDQISNVIEPRDAGLHFKLPWPIEQVHRYDTRLRTFETEFRQLGTEDQKTIVLAAYATWRIDDGRQFLKSIGREDAAGPKIRDLLENRVSIVLRTHPLSQLVNADKSEMKFSQIESEFLRGIKSIAEKNYGIDIVSVGIKRLGIPESVTKEVFNRMKEDRKKTIKELDAEGQAKALQIRVTAKEIAGKITARSLAYAKKIEGLGDAEAAKYFTLFAQNQELSDFLKKRETIIRMLNSQTTMVLDASKMQPFDLLQGGVKSTKDATKNTDKSTPPNGKASKK